LVFRGGPGVGVVGLDEKTYEYPECGQGGPEPVESRVAWSAGSGVAIV
jgi:hypothetical protein